MKHLGPGVILLLGALVSVGGWFFSNPPQARPAPRPPELKRVALSPREVSRLVVMDADTTALAGSPLRLSIYCKQQGLDADASLTDPLNVYGVDEITVRLTFKKREQTFARDYTEIVQACQTTEVDGLEGQDCGSLTAGNLGEAFFPDLDPQMLSHTAPDLIGARITGWKLIGAAREQENRSASRTEELSRVRN